MQVIDLSKIKVSCEKCNLAELCLPRGLDKNELAKLEEIARRAKPLQNQDVLFRTGDEFSTLYAVRSGSIKLYITGNDGSEQIIGFYFPGEIFGLDGIEKEIHSCTAVAMETSSLCAFPFQNISAICKEVPALQDQMFRLMSRELSNENQLLLSIGKKNAEERIATFLLSISSRFKRLGYAADEFKLAMSRQEIGNYLGLTIETVSRIFGRFQKSGLIAANRKFIKIINMEELHRMCTGDSPDRSHSAA